MLSRCFIAAALAVALPVLAQDYEIRLHRPDRVGQKTQVSISGQDSQEMAAWSGGTKMRGEKKEFTVNLEGVSTVLAVSPKGKASRVSIQVGKLLMTEGGIQKELLPRGTVVVAANVNKKTVFEVEGRAVQSEVAQALNVVVSIGSGDHTDDELFGTRERKRVGDSWEVNKTALADMMDDPRMTVKDIKGRMTLKNVLKDATGTRLLLTFEVTGQSAPTVPGGPMPNGTVTMKGTGEFPTDLSLSRVMETAEMVFSSRSMRKPNPNAAEVEMRMAAKRSVNAKFTPAK